MLCLCHRYLNHTYYVIVFVLLYYLFRGARVSFGPALRHSRVTCFSRSQRAWRIMCVSHVLFMLFTWYCVCVCVCVCVCYLFVVLCLFPLITNTSIIIFSGPGGAAGRSWSSEVNKGSLNKKGHVYM